MKSLILFLALSFSLNAFAVPTSNESGGDAVMSCDLELERGTCEFRPVQQLITNTTDRLIYLTFNGRILRATENHPFYVVDRKEWVEARDLRVGEISPPSVVPRPTANLNRQRVLTRNARPPSDRPGGRIP